LLLVRFVNIKVNGQGWVCLPDKGEIKIIVKGHASFAKKGKDIVCAAVSILAQTMVLAVEKLTDLKQQVLTQEGYLESKIDAVILKESGQVEYSKFRVILSNFFIGLESIRQEYPDYIKIDFI